MKASFDASDLRMERGPTKRRDDGPIAGNGDANG
jgi:hypothetical protein